MNNTDLLEEIVIDGMRYDCTCYDPDINQFNLMFSPSEIEKMHIIYNIYNDRRRVHVYFRRRNNAITIREIKEIESTINKYTLLVIEIMYLRTITEGGRHNDN